MFGWTREARSRGVLWDEPEPPRRVSRTVIVTAGAASLVLVAGLILAPDPRGTRRLQADDEPAWVVAAHVASTDAGEGSIHLTGDLVGMLGAKVVVTGNTWVGIDGRLASIAEVPEGATVRAAIARDGGRKVARWISVIPADDPAAPRRPETRPSTGRP
jgi:hypothetical protein